MVTISFMYDIADSLFILPKGNSPTSVTLELDHIALKSIIVTPR